MFPGFNAVFPQLLDAFGGRQSARSIHFISATLIVLFVFVYLVPDRDDEHALVAAVTGAGIASLYGFGSKAIFQIVAACPHNGVTEEPSTNHRPVRAKATF